MQCQPLAGIVVDYNEKSIQVARNRAIPRIRIAIAKVQRMGFLSQLKDRKEFFL